MRTSTSCLQVEGVQLAVVKPARKNGGTKQQCRNTAFYTAFSVWIYRDLPATSGKWRFTRIPYKKTYHIKNYDNLGGDCYWVGGWMQDMISFNIRSCIAFHPRWECFTFSLQKVTSFEELRWGTGNCLTPGWLFQDIPGVSRKLRPWEIFTNFTTLSRKCIYTESYRISIP